MKASEKVGDNAEKLAARLDVITETQAQRLAALTDIKAEEIVGRSPDDLTKKFPKDLAPLLTRKITISGQVVKTDLNTGVKYPVPFATVYVQDADVTFLGYFPVGQPWGWQYPLRFVCHNIASTRTDACGNFQVEIPALEIEYLLFFRKKTVCSFDVFTKLNLRELLHNLEEIPELHIPHPNGDPPPDILKNGGITFQHAVDMIGRDAAEAYLAMTTTNVAGADSAPQIKQMLTSTAFSHVQLPPVAIDVAQPMMKATSIADEDDLPARFSKVMGLEPEILKDFDPSRFEGPVFRCKEVWEKEYVKFEDVPDIVFKVTQIINRRETVIYSEKFLDARWNTTHLDPVVLEASQTAIAAPTPTCEIPNILTQTAIGVHFAGLMPLDDPPSPALPYHNAKTGYALRVNRPQPQHAPWLRLKAQTPYEGTLQLYGQAHGANNKKYRILYSFKSPSALTFSPLTPFVGVEWTIFRLTHGQLETKRMVADQQGWYTLPVEHPPMDHTSTPWFPGNLLLQWPTQHFQDGCYRLHVELSNNDSQQTDNLIAFQIDNAAPSVNFLQLAWRILPNDPWNEIPRECPVISRPAVHGKPANVELQVKYSASERHLRSVIVRGYGCGHTNLLPTNPEDANFWYHDPITQNYSHTVTFKLPSTLKQGAYNIILSAASRAFNPAGGDEGPGCDWEYNPAPKTATTYLPFAIVNI